MSWTAAGHAGGPADHAGTRRWPHPEHLLVGWPVRPPWRGCIRPPSPPWRCSARPSGSSRILRRAGDDRPAGTIRTEMTEHEQKSGPLPVTRDGKVGGSPTRPSARPWRPGRRRRAKRCVPPAGAAWRRLGRSVPTIVSRLATRRRRRIRSRAHGTSTAGPCARGGGTLEPGHRQPALRDRADGQGPHQAGLREAGTRGRSGLQPTSARRVAFLRSPVT